ncbi:MAG: hypothetical protein ACOCY0_04910 [Roseicyclus sp.]
MRFIRPTSIGAAQLAASNVPEDDAPAWDVATAYTAGDQALVSPYVYEALRATTGESPPDNLAGADPAWLRLDNSNRWRMFNRRLGSATVASEVYASADYATDPLDAPAGIAVTVAPGALVDAVAVLEVDAVHIDLIVEDGGTIIYQDRQMLGSELSESSWWHYFFEPLQRRSEVVWFGLPRTSTATYRVSAYQPGTPGRIGALVLGEAVEIGQALEGSSIGVLDFSRKEQDEFGGWDVVQRAYAREMDIEFALPFSEVTIVQRYLAEVRAVPVVWQASDAVDATIVYGFIRDWRITISSPTICFGAMTIEGLT